jgi:hypothetical protein
MFHYFKSIYSPAIKIPSVELDVIQSMVELITDFASFPLFTVPFDGAWDPVNKTHLIPEVLNINNTAQTMILLPEYANIKALNDIYTEAKVPLI